MSHVYVITNLVNNKIYIGKTNKTPENRLRRHFYGSAKSSTYLARAIVKHGRDVFVVRSLVEVDSDEEASKLEKFFIRCLESTNSEIGYNLTLGGDGICGYKHTEASKKQCGISNIGKHVASDSLRQKLRESRKRFTGKLHPRFGAVLSAETKAKMRAKKIGKPWTDARRKAQSARRLRATEFQQQENEQKDQLS